MVVGVTGAAGAVGSRVLERLERAEGTVTVRSFDRRVVGAGTNRETVQLDLGVDDLGRSFVGLTSLVHLATATTPRADEVASVDAELHILDRVLAAAAIAGVSQLVVLSTAMVYGAWPGNPMPLTEDAPIRPNPDFAWAATRVRVEQRCQQWGKAHGVAVAVLRPTAVVADDSLGELARVLHSANQGIVSDGDPPAQYLHVDDLASAVAAVLATGFDGVVNVAPDGWISPNDLAQLEGTRQGIRAPLWVARQVAGLRTRYKLAPVPAGVVPYTANSWVVANDRLRSLGWSATYSNEEAWVVSHEPSGLERLPARRRQELALAATATLGVGVGSMMWAAVRRWRRSREG